MVSPWEIDPGRDGVTVFRITGTDYSVGANGPAVASLKLDSYPPTVARALAQLARRRTTRQR